MRTLLHRFDHSVTSFIQQWELLHGLMLTITHFGHPAVTLTVGAVVAIFGGMASNIRMIYAGMAVFLTLGMGSILKILLHRERPLTDYVFHMTSQTFSFPSGHTVGATVAYGLLAYLAITYLPHPWHIIIGAGLIGLIILISLSRVYLGAHYPSDVFAGWIVGGIGLAIIIFWIKP